MKVTIVPIVLILFLLGENLTAQRIDDMLIPFEEDGKWGYVDSNDSIIVPPKYEEAYPTFDLRGRVKLKGKYGFIDEKGKLVIKPKWDAADDFKFGITKVSKGGKSKIINTAGGINRRSISLCGGVYRQCLHPKSLSGIDTFRVNGKINIEINTMVQEDGKLSYYPDTLATKLDEVEALANQYVIFTQGDKKALFFDQRAFIGAEYIDTSLEFKYQEFEFFSCQDSKTEYHEVFGYKRNGLWGYIRLFYQPEEIIDPKYISIGSMERGVALVEYEKGSFGYIDQYGKEYFERSSK